MKRTLLLALVPILLATTVSSNAADAPKVKTRTVYDRSENTPDHMVFASTLRYIARLHSENPDHPIQILRRRLELYQPGAAEAFVSEMLDAKSELDSSIRKLELSMLCEHDFGENKKSIYLRMDALDDARENKAAAAYAKFLATMKSEDRANFSAWLQKSKEGFYHRTIYHESLYENSSTDVISKVTEICVALENSQ